MRPFHTFLVAVSLISSFSGCGDPGSGDPELGPVGNRLSKMGIRFDGYYREEVGKVVYVIRFFPEGTVVLANGTEDIADQLPSMLVKDAKGDPRIGHYKVPVTIQGDSLFFTTKATRGDLSYSGAVLDASRVRFLRHSHINGADHLKEYIFYPDASAIQ